MADPSPPKKDRRWRTRRLLLPKANFRTFFARGLAILLPTVLTIWILLAAYQFVSSRIADPINRGVRETILQLTGFPSATDQEIQDYRDQITAPGAESQQRSAFRDIEALRSPEGEQRWLGAQVRRQKLDSLWGDYSIVLNLIGLIIAVAAIYVVGVVLGSFIGRRLYYRGEQWVQRLPLIRNIYPSVKQVTDFFVGSKEERVQFNRVIAVEYPRKGIWSVGLVTGDTMWAIEDRAGGECLTVFIPSSPTPFTGYVITVPKADTIDLPISIEEALKFTVSGGVLIPPSQKITRESVAPAKIPAAPPEEKTEEPGDQETEPPRRGDGS